MRNKKQKVINWVGLFLIIVLLVGFLIFKIVRENVSYNRFPDRGLPRINIDLNNISLSDIKERPKINKYEGNDLQIYDEGKVLEYDDVEIKGRGNGTWAHNKKPYQIKFKNKVDLFEMGKSKKWILLANAVDLTCLRNNTAFVLAKMLNMKYSLEGNFVELYIGGDYEGVYYVTHAVEINKHVVDLKNQFGIIVELDNYYGALEENYKTRNGDLLVIKDLVVEGNKDDAMKDFLEQYNRFELAVKEKDYKRISELVDVESFAQYYLLSEFSVNPDAYWTSFYMYKDGIEDKIHAGPGWDFDLAFGNREWGTWIGEKFYSPTETMVRKEELQSKEFYEREGIENGYETSLLLSTIVFDLMDVPEFKEKVEEVFRERMSGRKNELIMMVNKEEKLIEKARIANNERWKKEDNNNLQEMLEWIRIRYDYFERIYGDSRIGRGSI